MPPIILPISEPEGGVDSSGRYINDFINSDSESHSVAGLAFAPDGALLVSIGDGASYNTMDPRAVRVQSLDSLSGKLLRIDPLTGQGLPDNPFYDGQPGNNRSKVYQYGFRHPFRFTVNPSTGQILIGDVGWTRWEEINVGATGAYYSSGAYPAEYQSSVFFNDLQQGIVRVATVASNGQLSNMRVFATGASYVV